MGKLLAFAIVLVLSLAAFAASPDYSLLPPRSGVDAYDMPSDAQGVITAQTADSQNRVNVLSLRLEGGCAGGIIKVTAASNNGPASGARVDLFSLRSPRTNLAEIRVDEDGKGAFGPRPEGKYEAIASLDGYRDARAVMEVVPCVSDYGVRTASTARPKPEITAQFSQAYASGFSRTFTAYTSTVGSQVKKYTDITLRYSPGSPQGSANLMETIPPAVWLNQKTIGYSNSYPIMVSNATPIMVVWHIGQQTDGSQTSVTYRIEREITEPMAEAFGEPKAFYEGENISANFSAPASAAATPSKSKVGSEAALSAPEIPSWALTAAIGILLIGITALVIVRTLTKPSS